MEEIVIIEQVEPEEIVTLEEKIEYVAPSTQEKEVTPTEQEQIVKPDEGVFALSKVTVNPIPSDYIKPELALIPSEINANNIVVKAKYYGEMIPDYFFNYNMFNAPVNCKVEFVTELKYIGNSSNNNSRIVYDVKGLENVIGINSYGLANGNWDGDTVYLPKWDGRYKGQTINDSVFRNQDKTSTLVNYVLPKVQYIESYWWYQVPRNITVQIGSIGYGLLYVNNRPFGSASGTSTVTCYIQGEKLDSLSAKLISQAGANYTFIFKASEDTVYNGTNYSAGETMLTIGG